VKAGQNTLLCISWYTAILLLLPFFFIVAKFFSVGKLLSAFQWVEAYGFTSKEHRIKTEKRPFYWKSPEFSLAKNFNPGPQSYSVRGDNCCSFHKRPSIKDVSTKS